MPLRMFLLVWFVSPGDPDGNPSAPEMEGDGKIDRIRRFKKKIFSRVSVFIWKIYPMDEMEIQVLVDWFSIDYKYSYDI
jgi:hypothetical protein